MKYAYENLGDEQFEILVIAICQKLFGISVQGFSKGPDGGRDAKFVGTAEIFPTKAELWQGTTIIQAKHTNGYNRCFSEADFFSKNDKKENSILAKEIPRIKKLRNSKELDNYILFSNRRLSGNSESEIRDYIAKAANIPIGSIYLCGVEQLENFLRAFPSIPQALNIDPIDMPLIVSPEDLAEVVQALAQHKKDIALAFEDPPVPRVPYEKKNILNNMTREYATEQRKRYLKETAQISNFLSAPENFEWLTLYKTVVDEFQLKIIAKRKDYQTFDEVMEYVLELLFNRDVILRRNKRLTRAILFFMYWNCDIGATENAETY